VKRAPARPVLGGKILVPVNEKMAMFCRLPPVD